MATPDCSACPTFERDNCPYPDKRFHCPGCDKDVPWCFGCADEDPQMFELCDACWCHVTEWRKRVRDEGGLDGPECCTE
jgi:hypothetical protein